MRFVSGALLALGLVAPGYSSQERVPGKTYTLSDVHRLLKERALEKVYVSVDSMTYFIRFNSRENVLWVAGRRQEHPATEKSGRVSVADPELESLFSQGQNDIVITSMGAVFGDDGYDYFARLGDRAEVGTDISRQHRDEYARILQNIGDALSKTATGTAK